MVAEVRVEFLVFNVISLDFIIPTDLVAQFVETCLLKFDKFFRNLRKADFLVINLEGAGLLVLF